MMEIEYSEHARKRRRHRALPEAAVDLVMSIGDEFKSHHGTRIKALVSKLARNEFRQELKLRGLRPKDKWCNVYAVIDPCGKLITIGYRHKKLFNHLN